MRKNDTYPKTHFEKVLDHINNDLGMSTDGIYSDILRSCGADPDYETLAQKMMTQDTIPIFNRDIHSSALFLNVFFHLYHMHMSHNRVYYITPELSLKLSNTELNIDTHFLKSPFRELYLQIEPGLFYITDKDGDHTVSGIYVHLRDRNDGQKELRVMAAAFLKETSKIPFNDSLFYFKILMGPGKIKDEMSKYMENEIKGHETELSRSGGLTNVGHIEELFNFVINVLLYITSKDPDIRKQLPYDFQADMGRKKSKNKLKKIMKRASSSTSLPIMIVGSKFMDQHYVTEARECGGVRNWRLQKKVLVSGHWRTQWYGSESRDDRRSEVIFIEPYVKGPDMTDIVHKPYLIK